MQYYRCAAATLVVLAVAAPQSARGQQSNPKSPNQPAATPAPTPAATPAATPAPAETPKVGDPRINDLAERVDDLEIENEELQAELEAMYTERTKAGGQPARPNLMNPSITAFVSTAARIDSNPVLSSDGTRIDDRLYMRSAEIDFRSAIDPYADGVFTLALESNAGEGFEADVEEGYLLLKRIPILESAPLGMKVKIGRFRAPIGNVNRLHMHDLPWVTRPLAIASMLGTEQGDFFESGYNPEGIDVELLLPELISGVVMELNLDLLDDRDMPFVDGEQESFPGFLGRYNLFFTAGEAHDFNLGVSGTYSPRDHGSWLAAADVMYKWKPQRAGEFHSFVVGAELFTAGGDYPETPSPSAPLRPTAGPLAWFAFAQYQLNWHLYLGARYDYVEAPDDDQLTTRAASGYLSYYTSEYLRFRAGYEWRDSDLPAPNNLHSIFFAIDIVFGSHPSEPYWVNR